ncbi:hypothetical protein A2331_03555 [Candidatus Falkowbacteria bacterium RIFOXYB2_FULL_34_18]|uniref:Spermidine/putrescine ABC transporter substrate-binding protein n=1 Tax=Candidatus Falkowbacteria bacterium RIFOXYD2_FULL_34_120 TaxID=1798007 RepID=A0A1F5TSB3_9BACT|nr:MAG: hypothetical protein A2331_03555 [Candidatus Falkowbacteria bacterium RIFOXYB2_FULL_34_18]OGF30102.1 MAG: hypothetical protein A2500_04895 [Candidatus Falkowbacteria bacterium RIFOXYC12_FULL_34_55]OGF37564.1 MAG: hypothetical protein A2466_01950 [Candidatus Falkowbacteria bacterium RIFOXYC2_FULL_34_220]OGF39320.1 MAG: hypothetical protein A2515_02365 [Candidatus Falkowbacteria bacterium RIFOXYD12_FULL_34_57]OGF41825.1 MAG: hypothetical protein A2531_05350 [Candidatus Falkowbacteria bact
MFKKIIILLFVALFLSGCGQKIKTENTQGEKELNIYNWEDYLGETTIADFEKEFGVKVNLFTFEDEDFMLSDVQVNPDKYDLIIASDGLIYNMSELKLLSKINKNDIPNLKNIEDKFLNLWYDSENNYSVPYLWGTTGIIFNTKYIPEDTDSWSILFNEQYKGKIAMLNNNEEVIGAALKYLNYPFMAKSIEQLEEAKLIAEKQKDIISGYEDVVAIRSEMIDEKLWVAQIYSGEALYAMNENKNLKYIIPREGAEVWIDNLAIPSEAKNKETAEKFINFILRPDISADIANYLWYANTNDAAREFTNAEILEDEALYPPQDILEKLEYLKPNKFNNEYNKIWSQLQLK